MAAIIEGTVSSTESARPTLDATQAAVGYGYVRPVVGGHECGGALFDAQTRLAQEFQPHGIWVVAKTGSGEQQMTGRTMNDGHSSVGQGSGTAVSPWLTAEEAAQRSRCGIKTIYREVRAKRLKAARVGGRRELRLLAEWIDEWLLARTTVS